MIKGKKVSLRADFFAFIGFESKIFCIFAQKMVKT